MFEKGDKFGKFTILNKTHKGGFDLQCECGKEVRYSMSATKKRLNVFDNPEFSGCVECNKIERRLLWAKDKEWQAKQVYKRVKRNAKCRGLSFKLTIKDIQSLIFKVCTYCGNPPSNRNTDTPGIAFYYNGLDRVNSSKGYVKENVVPCCIQCNKAKSNYSLKEFTNWIQSVYYQMFNDQSKDVEPKFMRLETGNILPQQDNDMVCSIQ